MQDLDLPPSDTVRWSPRRKASVVRGVRCGAISLEEACQRYRLSAEEFLAWQVVENVQQFPNGYRFHIRKPLFSVTFRTEAEAETARDAIAAALAPAIELNTFIRLSHRP